MLSGIATAILVFMLARKGRATSGYRLVLVGIGVGAIMSGINTVILVMGHLDQAASAQLWLAGSLTARTWSHVVPIAIGFAAIAPIAVYQARRIALIEMGDDAVQQLGVDAERTRLVMVAAAVGLTALATATAGPIAFIALAAPQLARRLTRAPDVPLVAGALMGAVLVLAADLVSQHAPFHIPLQIGQTTSLLGGVFLLWLLGRSGRV